MNTRFLDRDESSAAELSEYLRTGDDPTLHRRRWLVGLSLLSASMMGIIAAMQTGLLKLPRPKIRWLDGSIPNDSAEAYHLFSTPDGLLGLVSYGVTGILAAMGGRDRARTHPLVPVALAGKVAFDAANAVKLTIEQPTKYRAVCLFCITAAVATFATVPLVWPEAKEALENLTGARPQLQPVRASIGRVREMIDA